jgi:long-subunit acyl-CoA synthetase (AMP-forming)
MNSKSKALKNIKIIFLEEIIMADKKLVFGVVGLNMGNGQLTGAIDLGYEIGAICDIDEEQLKKIGDMHNIPEERRFTDYKELVKNPKVIAKIHKEVEKVNDTLAPHEKIKRERVILAEWSPTNGLLSPTLKLKRVKIQAKHADIIKEIYK